MIVLDFNSLKVLSIINKLSKETDIDIVFNKSKLTEDDFYEIVSNLEKNDYIKFPIGGYVESTNKGKTYFSKLIFHWFTSNFLAIIAILISIIALFK